MKLFSSCRSYVALVFGAVVWIPVLPVAAREPAEESSSIFRQHDAHVHGIVEINIALEDDSLSIELLSPAVNIVGFEYRPNTEEQEEAVREALETLESGANLFELTAAASCELSDVDVETDLIGVPSNSHEEEDAQQSGEGRFDDREIHSEFEASYRFICERPDRLRQIDVKLFSLFSGIEEIEVQALTETGQIAAELTPTNTTLSW